MRRLKDSADEVPGAGLFAGLLPGGIKLRADVKTRRVAGFGSGLRTQSPFDQSPTPSASFFFAQLLDLVVDLVRDATVLSTAYPLQVLTAYPAMGGVVRSL